MCLVLCLSDEDFGMHTCNHSITFWAVDKIYSTRQAMRESDAKHSSMASHAGTLAALTEIPLILPLVDNGDLGDFRSGSTAGKAELESP